MGIIFSHPTGNANSRAAVEQLAKEGMLDHFHTTIASFPGSFLDKLALGPFAEIQRRRYSAHLRPVTTTHPFMEACRVIASKAGLKKFIEHEKGIYSIDAVYRHLDIAVAKELYKAKKKGSTSVYAYEDGAAAVFEKARELGMYCFYDLPIGYWRSSKKFLDTELKKWPEWASTLTSLQDSENKLLRKDKELQLADCIFVASTFTATTLKEFQGNLPPVKIIPYGFPTVNNNRNYQSFVYGRRLKLLFVGGLSQRKGMADLFSAVDSLSKYVELTIVGNKPTLQCHALDNALKKHHWIPSLPHHLVLKLMSENDVLVFPSLFEGFGLVVTEAMAQGTPVITTERTCGPDLITNNENGWIIKAGSTFALQAAIEKLIDDQSLIEDAGQKARQTAAKRPWEVYGTELVGAIRSHFNTI